MLVDLVRIGTLVRKYLVDDPVDRILDILVNSLCRPEKTISRKTLPRSGQNYIELKTSVARQQARSHSL